jgi:hypothetical protein
LNFWAKPESFPDDAAKINYVLSFLNGMALNYFKPFLTDALANKLSWLRTLITSPKCFTSTSALMTNRRLGAWIEVPSFL